MSDFKPFAAAVHAQYELMAKHELFVVDINPDDLYAAYLAAFPEGTNPIFRERTEHDCSCCKNHIRNIGVVVAIIDGQLVSVWDSAALYDGALAEEYKIVAGTLSAIVKAKPIKGLFRSKERSYGAESSKEQRDNNGSLYIHTWNHFHGKVHDKHFSMTPGQVVGDYNTTVGVFKRALTELKPEAFDTVIDLIESNSLYRGAEHLAAVRAFRNVQSGYLAMTPAEQDIALWKEASSPYARFRNTAIGSLLVDLSDGVDLEKAVKSFEAKVAPENYKRPTALITPKMVELAMATITELGIEPALHRRMARLSDVTVNNVLWVDNSARGQMKDGVAGLLMEAAVKPAVNGYKAENISIDDFMKNILPQASSIDLVVRNSQQGNFVTLTAPMDESRRFLKWDNNFAWSYAGNVTDAIKERVKAAGGTVEGDLCCRLAWEYTDDLDFHMHEPDGGHINFSNRRMLSRCGGMLDLDANGADGQRDDPAENIFYANRNKMKEGIYTLVVHNYNRRSNGKGFEVQIEFDGQLHHIAYLDVLRSQQNITVAKIQYKAGVFTVIESLPATAGGSKGVEKWGVHTETPTKVTTIMKSPNHWDGNATGNAHWIFMLDGCRNPESCRGFYNEQISSDLEQHRKVFETLGSKLMCPVADEQLSGVGFSSTRHDKVLVQVTGAKIRKAYNIIF